MKPPNAFHPVDPREAVWFAADACLELRPASARCGHCRDNCAPSAFDWNGAGVRVTADCVACGRCAAACPAGALSVRGFSFPAPGGRQQTLRIECRRVPASAWEGGTVTAVPCLGGLSSDDMLALVARGHGCVRLVDRGWCKECPIGGGEGCVADGAVAAAQRLLDQLGLPSAMAPRVESRPLPPAIAAPMTPAYAIDSPPLGRRAFFAALRRRPAEMVAPREPERAGPSRDACRPSPVIGNKLRQRADSLHALAQIAGRRLSARFFPAVAIGPACSNHGVCAAVCPGGALTAVEGDGGSAGLDFDAERCLACGLCVSHCPAGAVRLSPSGNSAEPHVSGRRTVVRHRLRPCSHCGRAFADKASGPVCPSCRRQRRLAAGLFGTAPADG